MGLNERGTRQGTFLTIRHDEHAIVQVSDTFVEGWEEINPLNPKTKKPVQKWIKKYFSIDGVIKRVEWYDSEQQYETRFMGVKLHLEDNGEWFSLELPFNTRPYDSFMKMAESIDYSKPVEISAWHDKKQDITAFRIQQDGATVKWKYTKDEPGEMPQAVHNKTLDKWNFDDQRTWLIERLQTVVIPHVDELHKSTEPMPDYTGADEVVHDEPKKKRQAKAAGAGSGVLTEQEEKDGYWLDDEGQKQSPLW